MIPSGVAWIPVVDVSYAQGPIDFGRIRAAGIPGVIIRACNGVKRDIRYDANWQTARRAGLDVGVYGFSNPKAAAGPGEQGAFLAALADESDASFVMHDEEGYEQEFGPNPVLRGAKAAAWTRVKVERCLLDSQRTQTIYTGAPYWNATFTPSAADRLLRRFTDEWRDDLTYLAQFELVLARYIAQKPGPPPYDMLPRNVTPDRWAEVVAATGKTPQIPNGYTEYGGFQFSAGGNMQGAVYGCSSTDLDLNIIRDTAYQRWFNPAPLPPPPEPPQEEDVPVKIWTLVAPEGEPVPTEKFIAPTPVTCVWADPHNTRFDHQMDLLRKADPNCDQSVQKANLLFVNLEGLLPTGWDPDDFINGDEIRLRYKTGATPAVDLEARATLSTVRQELDSLGAEEGALEARFERFLQMLRTSASG